MGVVVERVSAARRVLRIRAGALVLAVLVVLATVVTPVAGVLAVEQQIQAEVYFDRTGQTLGGPFYDGWVAKGGLKLAGEPVSPAAMQGGSWAQWFAFARLEIPKASIDQATATDAEVAPIGLEMVRSLGLSDWHPAFKGPLGTPSEGARVFPNGHTLAHAFKDTFESGDVGERLGMPISEEFRVGDTAYQFFERGALSWSQDYGVSFVPLGYFDAAMHSTLRLSGERPAGVPIYVDGIGAAPHGVGGEKWIDVNLNTYTLTAYEGETPVFSTIFVDGAADYPTVTGSFRVYWKLDKQTMRGRNIDGSEYVTEDVPWVMYFFQDFAIHGAYWRSSFGYSGSHGCVNVPVSDGAWLYSWADLGTRVEVHR